MGTFLTSLGNVASGVGKFVGGLGTGAISGLTGGMIEDAFGLGKVVGDTKIKMPKSGVVTPGSNPWFSAGRAIGEMAGASTDVGQAMSRVAELRRRKFADVGRGFGNLRFSYNMPEEEDEEEVRRRRMRERRLQAMQRQREGLGGRARFTFGGQDLPTNLTTLGGE